jgi:hypothetical protein
VEGSGDGQQDRISSTARMKRETVWTENARLTWPLDRAVDAYTAVENGAVPAKHALLLKQG